MYILRILFFLPPLGLQYRRISTPSSGEPYSLGAGNENWCQVPPLHQGIVRVKDIKEDIEVIREFSTPSPRGLRVGQKRSPFRAPSLEKYVRMKMLNSTSYTRIRGILLAFLKGLPYLHVQTFYGFSPLKQTFLVELRLLDSTKLYEIPTM